MIDERAASLLLLVLRMLFPALCHGSQWEYLGSKVLAIPMK